MRSERRLPAGLCAAVLCGALALASPAGAAAAPTPQNASQQPNPQKLWKQYPLNPKPSGSSKQSTRSPQSPRAQSTSSSGHSVMLTFLWIACVVVGAAWALWFARLLWWPERSRARPRSGLGTDDLSAALMGAVRRARTARQHVQHSFLGRARKSH